VQQLTGPIMRHSGEQGLLAGVRDVVDHALGVNNYQTTSAALELSKHGLPPASQMLVAELFQVLDRNWSAACPTARGSCKNFRWHVPKTHLGADNTSAEIVLERSLIRALVAADRNDWSNQVPLISGIAGPTASKRCAVDLVHRDGDAFEFVELKVASDTPVFAAIKVVVYALLWLLSRRDRGRLGDPSPILVARELKLSVLAPRAYYTRFELGALASVLDRGLRDLGDRHGVGMAFAFTAFPASFTRWDPRHSPPPSDSALIELLDGREPLAHFSRTFRSNDAWRGDILSFAPNLRAQSSIALSSIPQGAEEPDAVSDSPRRP
jgi:hypothetical protein